MTMRCLASGMAVVTEFTGTTRRTWARNNTLPGASDDVVIGVFSGSSIIVSESDVSVKSLNSSHAIHLSGVTFRVAENSFLNDTFQVGNSSTFLIT